jgi:hypothetical protein
VLIVATLATGCNGSDDTAAGEQPVTTMPGATADGKEYTVAAVGGAQVVEVGPFEAGEFVFDRLFVDFRGKNGEKGRFGEMWDELHPGQQALIPRARYIQCRDQPSDKRSGVAFKQTTLIQTTYQHPIDLTGIPDKTSTVVTMEVTVEDPPNGKLVTATETFELVVLDGEWKWVLPEADVHAFQKGTCPA